MHLHAGGEGKIFELGNAQILNFKFRPKSESFIVIDLIVTGSWTHTVSQLFDVLEAPCQTELSLLPVKFV